MTETKTCAACLHDKEPAHLRPCPECYRNGALNKFTPAKPKQADACKKS